MAFIGDTTAGQQFIATQDALEAPAQSESTAPTESSPFGKRIEAFRKALPGLERVAKRTEHRGKAATPWTDEELNAAKNRLHSLIFDGQERDKLPNADHERSVHFGYALAVHHAKLEGTPGQQAGLSQLPLGPQHDRADPCGECLARRIRVQVDGAGHERVQLVRGDHVPGVPLDERPRPQAIDTAGIREPGCAGHARIAVPSLS